MIVSRFITVPLIALPILLLLFLGGCEQQARVHQTQILALGTLVDISLFNTDKASAEQAINAVRSQMETIHHDWHAWEKNSPLSHINQQLAAGETAQLTAAGATLIGTGIRLSQDSNNLFNPAAGRLIALWGFHNDERPDSAPPVKSDIEALLQQAPSMNDLTLAGDQLSSSNPALQLDLGGYAKGYAVDLAIDALRQLGINNAIVNAGGDLRAIVNKDGQPWRIGIRNPRGSGVIASLTTAGDESIFTSGDYERYFQHDSQRYHHILDPRSGYPATGLTSVTVLHSDAATADAAATALFIAGPKQWPSVAAAMGVERVMVIDANNRVQMTPAMAARIQFEISPAPHSQIVALP